MSLNFIDISSHQAKIDLDSVFAQNPIDGVIVKSTEGTSYVNPYCDKHVQWCIRNGKPWGFYHFLNGSEPITEAKYFVQHTLNYFRDGIPCADYEAGIVQRFGTVYLRKWLETVYAETGIKPMVYCSLSTIQADVNGFKPIAEAGYPLWLAQWAGNYTNFVPHPWQSGSYKPFTKITAHQYTDKGQLNGYGGNLDLDIFYGDEDDWYALAGKDDEKPKPAPAPIPDMGRDAIVDAIIELLEKLR